VDISLALVNILTGLAIPMKSWETTAPVGTNGVYTFGSGRARMKFLG